MWTALASLGGVALGSTVSLIGVVLSAKKTHELEMERLNFEYRSNAYVEMMVALEHMVASADEVAPKEGDFGSLREGFEMGPEGRARIAARIQVHGSKEIQSKFDRVRTTFEELEKLAMHIWDVQDRTDNEGLEVSSSYGLEKLDSLRQQVRTAAEEITGRVRVEMQG